MQKKNGMKLLHGHNIKPRFLIYTAQSRCAQLSWLKKKMFKSHFNLFTPNIKFWVFRSNYSVPKIQMHWNYMTLTMTMTLNTIFLPSTHCPFPEQSFGQVCDKMSDTNAASPARLGRFLSISATHLIFIDSIAELVKRVFPFSCKDNIPMLTESSWKFSNFKYLSHLWEFSYCDTTQLITKIRKGFHFLNIKKIKQFELPIPYLQTQLVGFFVLKMSLSVKFSKNKNILKIKF